MASIDIEELRRAQAALAASDERLNRPLEGANDGWWDWDLLRKERSIRRDGGPCWATSPMSCRTTTRCGGVCCIPTTDDGRRWFVAYVTRGAEDGPLRVVVAHEDITEQIEAEHRIAVCATAVFGRPP